MMIVSNRLLHFSLKEYVSTIDHVGVGHVCLDERQALMRHELAAHMMQPILVLHIQFYLHLVHLFYLLLQKRGLAWHVHGEGRERGCWIWEWCSQIALCGNRDRKSLLVFVLRDQSCLFSSKTLLVLL